MTLHRVWLGFGAFLALATAQVLAQEVYNRPDSYPDNDPGAQVDNNYDRRFARISYLEGNLVFRHTSDPDWAAGSINTPLQEQDRIYATLNSKGEIEFDEGSFLRIAEDTEVHIVSLSPDLIQVELPVGLSTLHYSSSIPFEVLSPAGTVRLMGQGDYRIEVPKDGSLDVSVRKGTAEVIRPDNRAVRVRRNEAIYIPAEPVQQARLRPIDPEDGWDYWTDRRNASVVASVSRRYLPNDVYMGTYELDRYGSWVNVAGYGYCWRPMGVAYGWSPYRVGRWVYRPFWGWTWVSYEPWGWLPYHYGRWYYDPVNSWCWVPSYGFGASFASGSFGFSFWSPGLVSFYRYRGNLAWVPLGPRDHVVVNNYYFYNTRNSRNRDFARGLERLPRDRQFQNVGVNGAVVSVHERGFLTGRDGDRVQIPGNELIARGNRIDGVRDINMQLRPTVESRSPRPDVDVRRLGIVDMRRDVVAGDAPGGGIRPTVRTEMPGQNSTRDARFPGERRVITNVPGQPGQVPEPARDRSLEGGNTRRGQQRVLSNDGGTPVAPGVGEGARDRNMTSPGTTVPAEGRRQMETPYPGYSGGSRDVNVTSPGRRVIPGEGRPQMGTPPAPAAAPQVPVPNATPNQGGNRDATTSPGKRINPPDIRPQSGTTAPDTGRRDTPASVPDRRIVPGANRPAEAAPPPEKRDEERRTPPPEQRSLSSSWRDMNRGGAPGMTYQAPAPRVRVDTPAGQDRSARSRDHGSRSQRRDRDR